MRGFDKSIHADSRYAHTPGPGPAPVTSHFGPFSTLNRA